mmetsp:Transcript_59811/g.170113  ORF Transcript_59811/g.170113 Transcript_59811/m.170113 type:complete len:201 (-) Transcript_59811:209-811(-)
MCASVGAAPAVREQCREPGLPHQPRLHGEQGPLHHHRKGSDRLRTQAGLQPRLGHGPAHSVQDAGFSHHDGRCYHDDGKANDHSHADVNVDCNGHSNTHIDVKCDGLIHADGVNIGDHVKHNHVDSNVHVSHHNVHIGDHSDKHSHRDSNVHINDHNIKNNNSDRDNHSCNDGNGNCHSDNSFGKPRDRGRRRPRGRPRR